MKIWAKNFPIICVENYSWKQNLELDLWFQMASLTCEFSPNVIEIADRVSAKIESI